MPAVAAGMPDTDDWPTLSTSTNVTDRLSAATLIPFMENTVGRLGSSPVLPVPFPKLASPDPGLHIGSAPATQISVWLPWSSRK